MHFYRNVLGQANVSPTEMIAAPFLVFELCPFEFFQTFLYTP